MEIAAHFIAFFFSLRTCTWSAGESGRQGRDAKQKPSPLSRRDAAGKAGRPCKESEKDSRGRETAGSPASGSAPSGLALVLVCVPAGQHSSSPVPCWCCSVAATARRRVQPEPAHRGRGAGAAAAEVTARDDKQGGADADERDLPAASEFFLYYYYYFWRAKPNWTRQPREPRTYGGWRQPDDRPLGGETRRESARSTGGGGAGRSISFRRAVRLPCVRFGSSSPRLRAPPPRVQRGSPLVDCLFCDGNYVRILSFWSWFFES
jgi:hypothetical protein